MGHPPIVRGKQTPSGCHLIEAISVISGAATSRCTEKIYTMLDEYLIK